MATTLSDVAKKAGVSLSAVSLVFNNRRGIGNETRQRILQAARDLDYRKPPPESSSRPKQTMRFLKISRHGHTVSRDHENFIADYIEGIDQGARMAGYNLEVSMVSQGHVQEIIEILGSISAEGAIVLGTEMSCEEVAKLTAVKMPIVLLDTYYDYLSFDFVDMNNLDAAHSIVAHFVENGHREIGFIKGGVEVENFRQREKGFLRAMDYFQLPVNSNSVISVDANFEGAYRDMLAYLRQGGRLPPALFISNDIIAYGCIKAMRECKIDVPNDVSVIGFDDLPMSALMDVPLTTFSVSKRNMGLRAFELCASKVKDGNERFFEKVLISGKLIIRNSVKRQVTPVTSKSTQ